MNEKTPAQIIVEKINNNIDSTPNDVAKKDLKLLLEAVVTLFVDNEPRLVDPSIDTNKKGLLFFKSLGKLALEGGSSWAMQSFSPNTQSSFSKKVEKFMSLEDALMRYTK